MLIHLSSAEEAHHLLQVAREKIFSSLFNLKGGLGGWKGDGDLGQNRVLP